MDLKNNTPVKTGTGETVGELDRIVVDPDTEVITHIIVKKGWLFTKEKVIPASDLQTVSDEAIVLKENIGDLSAYRDFDKKSVVVNGSYETFSQEKSLHAQKVLWYYTSVDLPGLATGSDPYPTREEPLAVSSKSWHFSEAVSLLEAGSEVVDKEGHLLGKIAAVNADSQEFKILSITVQDAQTDHLKVIPEFWIKNISENRVSLCIRADVFEHLPTGD